MKKRFMKLISALVLSAMLLVSVFSVCRQMLMSCGFDCTQQAMSAIHLDAVMNGCAHGDVACSSPARDHMTTFASMYPAVVSNAAALLIIATGTFFLAWFLISKHEQSDHEDSRVKLKYLRQRIANSVAPDFLIFAFSRGILNSKIFA